MFENSMIKIYTKIYIYSEIMRNFAIYYNQGSKI